MSENDKEIEKLKTALIIAEDTLDKVSSQSIHGARSQAALMAEDALRKIKKIKENG